MWNFYLVLKWPNSSEDLMKLRFFTSWCRRNSVTGKVLGKKYRFINILCNEVAGKWSPKGWLCPRSQVSSWDGPPSEGAWLWVGRNSRVSHRKSESRNTYSTGRMWSISEGKSGTKLLGWLVGGLFHLFWGIRPLPPFWPSLSEQSWCHRMCHFAYANVFQWAHNEATGSQIFHHLGPSQL